MPYIPWLGQVGNTGAFCWCHCQLQQGSAAAGGWDGAVTVHTWICE